MSRAGGTHHSSLVTHYSSLVDSSLVGVFLTALAGIVFQLALTRLCSAALDYHLTFLAVSAAMLGTSAGGVWVAGWARGDDKYEVHEGHEALVAGDLWRAQRLCLAGAVALALSLGGFAWVPLGSRGPA